MAVVRSSTRQRIESRLADATEDWPDGVDAAYDYVAKRGVWHQLTCGRRDAALARVLDVPYATALRSSWPSFVMPLKVFRALGLERVRDGFVQVAAALPSADFDPDLPAEATAVAELLEDISLVAPAQALAAWALAQLDENGADAGLVIRTLTTLASALTHEHPAEALPLRARVLRLAEAHSGAQSDEALRALINLGHCHLALGRADQAEPNFRRAYECLRAEFGPDDEHALMALNNLGVALEYLGRLDEAKTCYQGSFEARVRTLGEEHPHTLISLGNLASVVHSQGQLADAEVLVRQVLAAQTRVLGQAHAETLMSATMLADVLLARQQTAEAQSRAKVALELALSHLGPGHEMSKRLTDFLAKIAYIQNDFVAARKLVARLHRACRRELGPNHVKTLQHAENESLLWFESGHPDQALRRIRRVERLRRQQLGPTHPSTLAALDKYAQFCDMAGYPDQAIPLRRRLWQARADQPDAAATREARWLLAQTMRAADRDAEAVPHLQALRAELEASGADDTAEHAAVTAALGGALLATERPAEAIALLRQSLANTRKQDAHMGRDAWVEEGRQTARREAGLHLAIALANEGEPAESLAWYRRYAVACRRDLGASAPDTSMAETLLAEACSRTGHTEEGVAIMRRLLRRLVRLLGAGHAGTALARIALADRLRQARQPEAAVEVRQRALAVEAEALGPVAAGTLQTVVQLLGDLRAAGRPGQALQIAEHALAQARAAQRATPDAERAVEVQRLARVARRLQARLAGPARGV